VGQHDETKANKTQDTSKLFDIQTN